ncbi:MAG: hypothetical protein AAFR01_02780 [Pseudomonadota bacterium]
MSDRPRQLVFDLPVRSALGAEDFLVTSANQAAVDLVDAWPAWPSPALIITGPPGAGKTHLATVWRTAAGGESVVFNALDETALDRFAEARAIVVENVHTGVAASPNGHAERLLFHLLNTARERGGHVLMTSRVPAGALDIALPDLRSRLRALPAAALHEPDDALLQGLLVKLFTDRQISIEPGIIAYLLKTMERSAEAARNLVAAVDHAALTDRRRVTRALVGDVLRSLQAAPNEAPKASAK